jgi:hypothetical protein
MATTKEAPSAFLAHKRVAVAGVSRWLHNLRRLRIRYERLPELHQAFLVLGCAVVCVRVLAGGDEPGLAASAESTTTGSR